MTSNLHSNIAVRRISRRLFIASDWILNTARDPRMAQKDSYDTLSRLVTSSSLLPKNNFVTRTCSAVVTPSTKSTSKIIGSRARRTDTVPYTTRYIPVFEKNIHKSRSWRLPCHRSPRWPDQTRKIDDRSGERTPKKHPRKSTTSWPRIVTVLYVRFRGAFDVTSVTGKKSTDLMETHSHAQPTAMPSSSLFFLDALVQCGSFLSLCDICALMLVHGEIIIVRLRKRILLSVNVFKPGAYSNRAVRWWTERIWWYCIRF